MPGNQFLVPIGLAQRKISVSPEQFSKLPVEERARMLSGLQPSLRLRYMTACDDIRDLVAVMEPQDVYLAVKEMGIHEAADIIALMTPEQFRICLDLDSWSGDELVPESATKWLGAMSDAPVQELAEVLDELDAEFLSALFSGFFRVFISREDFDPDEGDPPDSFTPDGVNYLQFTCNPHERELAKKIVVALCSERPDTAARIFSFVRDGMPIAQSEEAYRWRTSRLADLGFPDYNDALKLYSKPEKRKDAKASAMAAAGEPIPSFALVRHDGHSALPFSMLEGLGEAEMAAIAASAAWLINRLAVADRSDPGDVDGLVRTMDKARGMLLIGLDALGGDPSRTLCSTPLAEIFRTGYGKLLELQERALRLIGEHPLVAGDRKAIRLDELSRETLASVLQARPMFNGNIDFRGVDDVRAVAGVLDSIDASAEIFGKVFKVFKKDVAAMDLKGLNIVSRDDINACRLTNTAVANRLLSGAWSCEPIPRARLGDLFAKMFDGPKGAAVLSASAKTAAGGIAAEVSKSRPELSGAARGVIDHCLGLITEEMGGLDPGGGFEPAMIQSLLIRG